MGLISADHAVGAAFGAFMGGYLFDTTGSNNLLSVILLWLAVNAECFGVVAAQKHQTQQRVRTSL